MYKKASKASAKEWHYDEMIATSWRPVF